MRQTAKTLGMAVAIAALSTFGCTILQDPPRPKEMHAPFTLRPVGIESAQFVRAADLLIELRAPEYRRHSAEVHLGFGLLNMYGITDRNTQGDLIIVLGRPALMLATVEDLAMVLLHEYVHVVYWDEIFGGNYGGATEECKKQRAEMIANKVTVELYHKLEYRHDMLLHGLRMYRRAYTKAKVMECPLEITIDLPPDVRPLNHKGKAPMVRADELPEYVEDPFREEHLDPWDDPSKTDPLYHYNRPQPSNAK
jgi:hypothetical protein